MTEVNDTQQFHEVYKNAHSELLHFPDYDADTPSTVCGIDAMIMIKERHPVSYAGVWCTECIRRFVRT